MRRGARIGQAKPEMQTSKLGRDMDWMLDQWRTSSPEDRLSLVLAKIRAEEKLPHEPAKKAL
ncbi:MAG TPA: hypothetical protein VK464_23510 [Symbiobacteriaceae bacterium]|jgi:hypothetical protein|nr:hypothetical protein [Symbiobacteriaceae bacterium]